MDNLKLLNNVRKIDGIELNMNKHTEDIKDLSSQMDTIVQRKAEKYEVDSIQKQVDNLVIEASGDSNAEVIQSRDGENVLNERFKKIENLNRLTNTDMFTTEIEQERIVQSKKLLKHDLTIIDDDWFNIIYYTPIIGTTYYIEVPSKAYTCPIAIEKIDGSIEGIIINSDSYNGFKTVNAKITISSDVSKILICTTNANLNNIIFKNKNDRKVGFEWDCLDCLVTPKKQSRKRR